MATKSPKLYYQRHRRLASRPPSLSGAGVYHHDDSRLWCATSEFHLGDCSGNWLRIVDPHLFRYAFVMTVYILIYIYLHIYYTYTWLYIDIYMYQWVTALKEPHLESINPYKFRSLNFRLRDFRRWNHFDLAEQETSFQWTTGNGLSQYMSPEIWVEQLAGQLANSKLADTVNMTHLEYVDLGWYPFQCWWLLHIFITILQLVNTCNWCCNCPEEALEFLVFIAGGCDDHRSHRFRPSPELREVFWKWEKNLRSFSLTKQLVAFLT